MKSHSAPWLLLFGAILLLYGCQNPTEVISPTITLNSPDQVVQNLTRAYHEKDLKRYLSNFTEDSKFTDGLLESWGKPKENLIHQRMFALAEVIDLTIVQERIAEDSKNSRSSIDADSLRLKNYFGAFLWAPFFSESLGVIASFCCRNIESKD